MSKISQLINSTVDVNTAALSITSSLISKNIKSNVNHPKHYLSKAGIEAIDVIEAFELNFNLGNVVKYILRCGKKDVDVQELEKAKWYLEREITNRVR